MVFSSLSFLFLFLPLTLALYYILPTRQAKNVLLIIASLVFYAWGEPIWVTLLIFSATIDFFHGKIIENNRGRWPAKLALFSSIVLNIGLLAAFKYSGFIVENLNWLLGTAFEVPENNLPIGISFYTFQTVSYVVDVYRSDVGAQKSYSKFLLFVSLFHQLVAGPIVRYKDIAQEIETRTFKPQQFSDGITRFAVGLAKKVVIANTAGELAGPFLGSDFSTLSTLGAWYGIFLFGVQIYFDFSGYSDMAIGLGKMFGFTYKENFRYPYAADSATDFWRRWHISLGSFFRDYVYIPLGGNRQRFFLNLLVVWFLTGLWHGASWNFVLWGLYYGLLVGIEKGLSKLFSFQIPRFFRHVYLIGITLIGWSLFYFEDLGSLGQFFTALFGFNGAALSSLRLEISVVNNAFFLLLAILASLPVVPWIKGFLHRQKDRFHTPWSEKIIPKLQPLFNLTFIGVGMIMLVGQTYNPFLYFRF
jgi:alginate O-acetyltransferase complex protein AlgI